MIYYGSSTEIPYDLVLAYRMMRVFCCSRGFVGSDPMSSKSNLVDHRVATNAAFWYNLHPRIDIG